MLKWHRGSFLTSFRKCLGKIKFGSRIPEARAQMEQMESTRQEEHLQYASEEEDRQQEGNCQKEAEQEKEWKNVMAFTDSDYIFLEILAAVAWILLGIS